MFFLTLYINIEASPPPWQLARVVRFQQKLLVWSSGGTNYIFIIILV